MRPPWGPGGPRGWCHCLLQDLEWEGVVPSSPAWGPVAPLQPRRLSQQLRPHRGKGSPRWQLPSPSCLSLDAASLPSRVGEGPHPSFGLALFTPRLHRSLGHFSKAPSAHPRPSPTTAFSPTALFGRAWSSVHERVACTETRPHFPLLLPALSGLRPHLSIEGTLIQLPAPPGHLWATYFSIEAFVSRPALALDWAEKTQVRVF